MRYTTLKRFSYLAFAIAAIAASSAVCAASYNFRVAAHGLKPANLVSQPQGPFNFTTCGKTGYTGPTTCPYSGTSLAGLVTVSAGIQNWTVPASGNYTITLAGAAGGHGTGYSTSSPGRGAVLTTKIALTQGAVIQILVGQVGGSDFWEDGGGGGGTYIAQGGTPLAVAGGGGGDSTGRSGIDASTSTATTGRLSNGFSGGSGGAGFSNNGNTLPNQYGGFGVANSFLNGGVGPNLVINNGGTGYEYGGFGGGGGGGVYIGGGGGGYTPSDFGAGGNSYSSTTIISASATNTGAGYVTITLN